MARSELSIKALQKARLPRALVVLALEIREGISGGGETIV